MGSLRRTEISKRARKPRNSTFSAALATMLAWGELEQMDAEAAKTIPEALLKAHGWKSGDRYPEFSTSWDRTSAGASYLSNFLTVHSGQRNGAPLPIFFSFWSISRLFNFLTVYSTLHNDALWMDVIGHVSKLFSKPQDLRPYQVGGANI